MLVRSRLVLLVAGILAISQPSTRKLVGVSNPRVEELSSIRRAGYNAVRATVRWRDIEPVNGGIDVSALDPLLRTAAEQALTIDVLVRMEPVPAWAGSDRATAERSVAAMRERLPRVRQIQAVPTDAGGADAIRVGTGAAALAQARLALWTAIARGAGEVWFEAVDGRFGGSLVPLGETAGVVTRNEALFAPLQPRTAGVRSVDAGGGAAIEVRLLESPQALVIIALNRGSAPRTARIAFDPDIPEAIWQNLETGAAVSFVMERGGPVLEHTFAAADALVLMRAKRLR